MWLIFGLILISLFFFVGRDENEWVGGIVQQFFFFLPRREPKGGRSGRWETQKKIQPPLQLISLGDRKLIGQLARYSRMDYVKKCVNTRFEMASSLLQDKQALLDSAGSPLFDPEEPVYATALTSARKMCVQQKLLTWPSWITIPMRATRGQVRV